MLVTSDELREAIGEHRGGHHAGSTMKDASLILLRTIFAIAGHCPRKHAPLVPSQGRPTSSASPSQVSLTWSPGKFYLLCLSELKF
jgi:hypothetical protein